MFVLTSPFLTQLDTVAVSRIVETHRENRESQTSICWRDVEQKAFPI